MKKFIALVALVMMSAATTAMYAQESRAERRADRKAQRDAERARLKAEEQVADAVSYDDAVAALKAHQFVLEADQVMFRNGQTAFVNSNTNFVLVNQGRGTVQVAFNTVYPGPNGIGGVTVDGSTSDMQITTDKKGNVNCQFSIQGIGISAQIFISLTNGGNNATVTISPNFNSNTMTLTGNLNPASLKDVLGKALYNIYISTPLQIARNVYICSGVFIFLHPNMREFIIADNQDITKAGMMFLLSSQKDTALLLEADNKAELVQQLRLHPQAVVILDYTLLDFSGADELIVLHERFKEADWLLFSDELSMEFLRQVLFSSMAFGVVLKDNSKEEILSALQCASRKERFICNHVSNLLLSGSNASPVRHTLKDDLLTPAERSVLKEIALGKTTKEIAAEKNLSFHTVNSHRKNIFRKLGVNNVHEATKYAMKAGIVDLVEYYI